jgi:hypothetical protein
MRGLRPEEAKLRAAGGGEGALVRWLREGARRSDRPRQQQEEVRGLPAEGAKIRAAGGEEETVVRWLRAGAQGVKGHRQRQA